MAPARTAFGLPLWALGVIALLIVVATIGLVSLRDTPGAPDAAAPGPPAGSDASPGGTSAATGTPGGTPAAAATSAPPGGAAGRAYAVDIMGSPEVADGETIYSVLTASVVDRGDASTVWLRLRVSNDGRTAIALTSDRFQLAVNGQTLSSTTRFSEGLPAFSLTQKLVSYELPSVPPRAQFRVLTGTTVGLIDLDLRPSGRRAVHDQVDPGDALSLASLSTIVSAPVTLPANGDLSATLLRVTRRRFANLQRITATVRYENKGRYDQVSWGVVLHLVDGADVIPPVSAPSVAVRGLATHTADSVFDLPTSARSVQLRATADKASQFIPLRLP